MAIQKINLGTEPLGEGGDTYRSANTKINENFSNTTHAASRLVGTELGNVVTVGALGIGRPVNLSSDSTAEDLVGMYAAPQGLPKVGLVAGWVYGIPWIHGNTQLNKQIYFGPYNSELKIRQKKTSGGEYSEWATFYNTVNTTRDSKTNLLLGGGNELPENSAASRLVGKSENNVPQVSDLVELVTAYRPADTLGTPSLNIDKTGYYFAWRGKTEGAPDQGYTNVISMNGFGTSQIQFALPYNDANHNFYIRSRINNNTWEGSVSRPWAKIYHSENTTKDSNGFIKASSPVLRVFSDHIEGNGDGEAMGAEFVKKGVGNYLIKGTTGLADEGWYVTLPQDANGNNLVAVEYESLDNGDVSLRTFKRKFDFETVSIVADHDNPLDIPDTRWIDLRFNELPQEEPVEPEEELVEDEVEEPIVDEESTEEPVTEPEAK